MSFRSLRIIASACLALASLSVWSADGWARDNYRSPAELEPLHHDNDHEIIFEMEPLRPVKSARSAPAVKPDSSKAQADIRDAKDAKAAAKRPGAAEPVTAKTEAPAPVAQTPTTGQKPDEVPKVAESPKPAEAPKASGAPEPVEAARAVETQPVTQSVAAQTTPVHAEQAPAAPANDASQPVPLPLDQALAPDGAAENPAADATTPAADQRAAAPASEAPPAAPGAEQAEATPAQSVPQSATDAAAPSPADAPKRIAALLAQGVKGPAEVRLAEKATMFLPAGRVFIADEAAHDLAREAGLDWRKTMRGLIAPAGDELRWLAPVELLEDGFIKSDVALEADKLMAAFSAGLPEVNAQRAKAGQPAVELAGWLSAPALDDKHRLSACANVATVGSDADKYFNCEAWALGRDGALKVSLAEGGEEGDHLKGEAKALAETIAFDHGKTYEEVDLVADKVAPYSAADLLTSDVAAKGAPASVEDADSENPIGLLVLVAKLWKVILIALAALIGVVAWMRRKSTSTDEVAQKVRPASQTSVAPRAGSLFAKLLPTLHAKFAKSSGSSVSEMPSKASSERGEAEDSGIGGLMGKFSERRGKGDEAKTSRIDAKLPVDALGDDAAPATALKKLAARMRREEPVETVEKVDVSRALRSSRTLPGAAPEAVNVAETRTPSISTREPAAEPPVFVEQSSTAKLADGLTEPLNEFEEEFSREVVRKKPMTADDDGFGLVEPGDTAATSAAMHARESLRRANG